MYCTHIIRGVLTSVALVGAATIAPAQMNVCQTSPNSVGPGAIISSTGSLSIADNDFELIVSGTVPNEHGLFFFGPTRYEHPLGNGVLCIKRARTRFLMMLAPPDGIVSQQVDFGVSPASAIVAGVPTYFQYQYRDPVGGGPRTFNFSDALRVVFTP